MMLVQPSAKRHFVILDNHDQRKPLHRCQIHAFVKYPGFGGAVANPRESNTRFASELKCERKAGNNCHYVANVAYRRQYTLPEVSDMKVSAARGRISGAQVTTKHIRKRHAHLMTAAGVTDHRSNEVD